jgi:hypothetical protein
MTMEEVERFEAASDDGTVYTVIVYQQPRVLRKLAGDEARSRNRRALDLRLLDGSRVMQIDSETFKIVKTDELIRRLDQAD